MNSKNLINKLPYNIPTNIVLKLNSSSNLSDKLNIIRNWVHYNKDITHEERLQYHQPILNIAIKNKFLEQEAISLSNIVKIHDRLGQFKESIRIIEDVQKIWIRLCLKEKKYYNNLIISYCDKSVTFRLQNRLDLALETLYECYEFIKKNNYQVKKPLIILFTDLGSIYEKLLDYPAALNYFNESLNIINKSNNPNDYLENKIICHINIGNIYKETHKLQLACKKYKKAINLISDELKYYQQYIIANINLGQVFSELKQYKKALLIYNKALLLCMKSGSNMDLGFLYVLIAEVYFEIKDISKYDKFIKKGNNLVIKAAYPRDMLYLNKLLFKYYILKNNIPKAISTLFKSLNICKKNKLDNHQLGIYQDISDLYKNQKDIENAFKYSLKYIQFRKKIDKKMYAMILNEKQQSLNRMQKEINSIKQNEAKKLLELDLQYKNHEIISKKLHSVSTRAFLEKLNNSLNKIKNNNGNIVEVIHECKEQINISSSWSDFLKTYEQSNPKFMRQLRILSNKLSQTEIRVCSLIHLGLDTYEIAQFMSISKRSIEQHRYRIKKKLVIDINLAEFLINLS